MEPRTAAPCCAGGGGKSGLQALSSRTLDRSPRLASPGNPQPVASCLSSVAYRDQALPLYRGELSATTARGLERRSEGVTRLVGRGPRPGCAVGNRAARECLSRP